MPTGPANAAIGGVLDDEDEGFLGVDEGVDLGGVGLGQMGDAFDGGVHADHGAKAKLHGLVVALASPAGKAKREQ